MPIFEGSASWLCGVASLTCSPWQLLQIQLSARAPVKALTLQGEAVKTSFQMHYISTWPALRTLDIAVNLTDLEPNVLLFAGLSELRLTIENEWSYAHLFRSMPMLKKLSVTTSDVHLDVADLYAIATLPLLSDLRLKTTVVPWDFAVHPVQHGVATWPQLQSLTFHSSRLTEGRCPALEEMSSLQQLTFSGCKVRTFPAWVGQMASLTRIVLDGVHALCTLPASITQLQHLSSISISTCNELRELPRDLGQLTALGSLSLFCCPIIKTLPKSLTNLTQLTSLSIRQCSKIRELPRDIGNMSSLVALNLQSSRFNALPPTFGSLTSLTSFVYCDLGGEGDRGLPRALGNLTALVSLDLQYSRAHCLPPTAIHLSNLSTLNLSGLQVRNLGDVLGHLASLHTLHLCDQRDLTDLPESIVQLSRLTYLSLEHSIILERLPEDFGELACLQHLDLAGTMVAQLPGSFTQLSRLTHLSLWSAPIAHLPPGMEGLDQLRILNLAGSNLEEVPASLGSLPRLRHLDFSFTAVRCLPAALVQPLAKLQFVGMRATPLEDCLYADKCWCAEAARPCGRDPLLRQVLGSRTVVGF